MHFYLALTFISFVGVWIYRKIALKVKIIDIPNERSSHTIPTPRGAGVAVAGAWFFAIGYMYFVGDTISSSLFYALLSGAILVITGIVDDIWNISPKIRLLAQILAASLALYFLGGFQKVDVGFYIFDNVWILTPLAFIAIIWFINLFNFLDGIDGYLGSEVFFITVFTGFYFMNGYALATAAVTLGFLFLNWPKAKIFMGDVGSTLLGFNIAILALYFQNEQISSLLVWVMLSSLFWFDATLTLLRRYRNKENLLQAHRKHAYQRIVQAGFSHQKTLLYSLLINLVILLLVILSINYSKYIVLFFFFNIMFLYLIDKLISRKNPFL